jgi:hypothetical protein
MPGSLPSKQAFTLLSAAAIVIDTLVAINSSGKAATVNAGEDWDGVALNGTAAINQEVSVDSHSTLGNLTIVGTCAAGDLLSTAASGGVKKFSGQTGQTVTVANATDVWTATAHGLTTGERIRLSNSGGALPANAVATTDYYVFVIDANTFKLYTSRANALLGGATGLLDVSGDGTGTQTLRLYGDQYIVGKAIQAATVSGQKVTVMLDKRHIIYP